MRAEDRLFSMIIGVASIFVEDQSKALTFYTDVLGFLLKNDIRVGGEDRWLTVVSPENPDGVELLLEPSGNPAATAFQQAIFAQGIPATVFSVNDIQAEYERLTALSVEFTMPPTDMGVVTVAVFNDTCGNLINILQEHA